MTLILLQSSNLLFKTAHVIGYFNYANALPAGTFKLLLIALNIVYI